MNLFSKEKKNIDINVAPLIDIVFLLLIFFMLASEFTDFKTIDMVSPNQSNKEINETKLPIIIELSENGIININNKEIAFNKLSITVDEMLTNKKINKVVISTPNETKVNVLIKIVDIISNLINIVFLLLIFFMLSGTLAKTDLFEVNPPKSNTSSSAEAPELVILISDDSKIALDNQPIKINDLEIILAKILETTSIEEILIKADGNAKSGVLSKVIKHIRNAGIKRAAIVTQNKDKI